MTPILYSVNIATLATWLSVAGFGTVGVAVPMVREMAGEQKSTDPYANLESIMLTEDFSVGDLPAAQETDTGDSGEAAEVDAPLAEQDTLPEPPEMPDVTDVTPLPEIPDLPLPSASAVPSPAPAPVKERPVTKSTAKTPSRSSKPTSPYGGSVTGSATSRGTVGNGGSNGGSGMSDAKRLAGGRMPPPSYPAAARASGQAGTVLVEFVVGENGRVVSASAKNPSPWPILNERAVSCVRTWRFPPGNVTKYVRPIVFKLN